MHSKATTPRDVIINWHLTLYIAKAIILLHRIIWSWYTGRWGVGCYILYSEQDLGGAALVQAPPR